MEGGTDVVSDIRSIFGRYSSLIGSGSDGGGDGEMVRDSDRWDRSDRSHLAQSSASASVRESRGGLGVLSSSSSRSVQRVVTHQVSGAAGAAGATVTVTELQDRLRFSEMQLRTAKEDAAVLAQQYRESLTKLSEALKIVEEKAHSERALLLTVKELEARLAGLDSEKEAVISRSIVNLRSYEEESAEKARELSQMSMKTSTLEESLQMVRRDRVSLLEKVQALEAQRSSLEEALGMAEGKLRLVSAEAASVATTSAQVPDLRAQIQHLQADNARLVRLLATTAEYKRFMSRAFPQKPGGARSRSVYLPPSDSVVLAGLDEFLGGDIDTEEAPEAGSSSMEWADVDAHARHYGMQNTPLVEPDAEDESWIPGDAARITTGFRRQHLRHVPVALIRDFLLELNGVWRRRMNSVVAGLKEKFMTQITELKRQLSQRVPYEELMTKAEVTRLSNDLHSLRSRSRSKSRRRRPEPTDDHGVLVSHSGKYGWCSRMPVHIHGSSKDTMMLEKSLATVENLSRKVVEVKRERDTLEQSVRELADTSVSKDAATKVGMQAFARGVTWFGKQAVQLADHLGDRITELTNNLQRMCAVVASSSDSSLAEIRQEISSVAAVQREVSQFRVAVRHLFTKSLEVAQLQDASVLDESRSIVSPSRLGAPSPARDGWM